MAAEVADSQACKIESQQRSNEAINEEVNKLTKVRQKHEDRKPRKMTCYSCGGVFPHVGGKMKCPAWGKKCLSCDKFNHFSRCCQSGNKKPSVEKIKTIKGEKSSSRAARKNRRVKWK